MEVTFVSCMLRSSQAHTLHSVEVGANLLQRHQHGCSVAMK